MLVLVKFPFPVDGVVFFGLIIIKKSKLTKQLLNHELIHHRQQTELWFIGAYVLYFFEFWTRVIAYKGNMKKAYYMTSFEREAYQNQYDMTYLLNRKKFSFLDYVS